MRFAKTGNMYQVVRITGSQNSFLEVTFSRPDSTESNIKVIELTHPDIKDIKRTSKDEVFEQQFSGLESANEFLGTNYRLSKMYFSPYNSSKYRLYSGLTSALISHYRNGRKFKEY